MCYYKCMKAFFGYRKYDSVTNMLLVIGLPGCDTIWHNAKVVFNSCESAVDNRIVHFLEIGFFLSCLFNFYAALPRRGPQKKPPHIASHSVCPSVRLSVRPSRYRCHR